MATMVSVVEALEILIETVGDEDVNAEDEIIYAGPSGVEGLNVRDRLRLEQLGWFVSAETGRWCTFTE